MPTSPPGTPKPLLVPRFASQFYAEHSDRLLCETDMGFDEPMYRVTFRILESMDEHFYETEQFDYHWSLNGFGLPDSTLQRVFHHNNAGKILAFGTRQTMVKSARV
jgi:uncharacterized protein